jgi:predicted RNase H-like nuclease (RuvC/YqgF family)
VSDNEHPDVLAFQELEQLIRALGNEMAAWRRRAHEAEAQLRTVEASPAAHATSADPGIVRALERENEELRARLESARQRTEQLLERMRFLRQQHELGAER